MRHTAARSTVERETKEKDGVFTGCFAVNPVNGESIPDLGRRLRPDGVRHRGDHGVPAHDERDHAFARKYGIEIRQVVAPADGAQPAEEGAHVAHTEDEVLVNSGEFTGLSGSGGEARSSHGSRSAGSARPRSAIDCATGCSHGSATGAARSRSCTARRAASSRFPPISCPCSCRRSTTTCRRGNRRSQRPRTGWRRPARGAAGRRSARRTRWTRSSTRPGTSRYADARNDDAAGPADRRLLAAGQAVHRRRRARGAAPAVRALLHEGPERPRPARLPRAVLAPLHAGDDLSARREDVEDEGSVVSPDEAIGGTAPTRCASTSSTWGRRSRTRSGATRASRTARLLDRIWRLTLGAAARGPVDAPADGEPIRAHRTVDRVSDDILRRFQFHTPIAALFELVNEIYRVKDDPARAGEVRFATETVPARPAVRAARRRGAVGAARQRAAVGAAVARGGSGAHRRGDGRDRRPVNGKLRDRLQVPVGTPDDAGRKRARVRARAGARERRAAEDDRRARPPRQHRRVAAEPAGAAGRIARSGRRAHAVTQSARSRHTPVTGGLQRSEVLTLTRSWRSSSSRSWRCSRWPARLAGVGASEAPRARSAGAARARRRRTRHRGRSRLVVHVVGRGRRPGCSGSRKALRVADALARGRTNGPRADVSAVNLAAPSVDGQQVVVPRRGPPGSPPAGSSATGTKVSLAIATVEQPTSCPGSDRLPRRRSWTGALATGRSGRWTTSTRCRASARRASSSYVDLVTP